MQEGEQILRQFLESFQSHLLSAIGPGTGRVRMYLNEESIGSHSDGTETKSLDQVGVAASLRGINHDRAMSLLPKDRDRHQVQGIAGVGFKGADTAFAENEVRVAAGEDIFSGQEPLFDQHGGTALEQNRFTGMGCGDQELEVLSVAGANLDNIGILCDHFGMFFGETLGHDSQPGGFTRLGQELQPFFSQALKFVR